jgi:hypothetical protein
MHALETWAKLRKNAITPSTVLTAEVEQPPQHQQQPLLGKRKVGLWRCGAMALSRGNGAA